MAETARACSGSCSGSPGGVLDAGAGIGSAGLSDGDAWRHDGGVRVFCDPQIPRGYQAYEAGGFYGGSAVLDGAVGLSVQADLSHEQREYPVVFCDRHYAWRGALCVRGKTGKKNNRQVS